MAKEPGRRGLNQRVDKSRHQVELQTCTKDKSESLVDTASHFQNQDFDKTYLKLEEAAKERLDVNPTAETPSGCLQREA